MSKIQKQAKQCMVLEVTLVIFMGDGAQGGRLLACSSSLFPDVTQVCIFCEKSCSSQGIHLKFV